MGGIYCAASDAAQGGLAYGWLIHLSRGLLGVSATWIQHGSGGEQDQAVTAWSFKTFTPLIPHFSLVKDKDIYVWAVSQW